MDTIMGFIKYNSKIYRYTQSYLDRVLRVYGLGSGAVAYLFMLEHHHGIRQSCLSREVGNDKAMSARTIAKLIDLGYVRKEEDQEDSRACKVYLTDLGRRILPSVRHEIEKIVENITWDLSEEEKSVTISAMQKILKRAQSYREQE